MGVGGQWNTQDSFTLKKETRYTLHRRLGGTQGPSGWVHKISPPPVFAPRPKRVIRGKGNNVWTLLSLFPLDPCISVSPLPVTVKFHYTKSVRFTLRLKYTCLLIPTVINQHIFRTYRSKVCLSGAHLIHNSPCYPTVSAGETNFSYPWAQFTTSIFGSWTLLKHDQCCIFKNGLYNAIQNGFLLL